MHRALVVALLLLAVPSALGDPPGVHTDRQGARVLPLPCGEDVFHFVIFGDRTTGPPSGLEVLRQAVSDTNLLGPDLVMTVGDLVGGYNRRPEWLAQMREFRAIMQGLDVPWYPVPGNHDVTWGGGTPPPGHHESDFETHFGPLYYWFEHKGAAFVTLYSDEGDRERNRKGWGNARVNRMSETQLAWLAKTLEQTKQHDHVFVFLHHPRWVEAYYPGSNWDAVHTLLQKAGNVTAVFAGHLHRRRYDGVRDGIEYFTLATTGGALPFEAPGTGYLHHMNVVTVRDSGMTVATIPVGAVLDPREMTQERRTDVDRLRWLEPVVQGDGLVIAAGGRANGTYPLEVENPASRPIQVTLSLDTPDRGWFFAPSHHHVEVPAGGKVEVSFRYGRDHEDGLAGLSLPSLALQADYLGETTRISLPERNLPAVWRLRSLPPDTWDGTEPRALSVEKNACLTVPAQRLDIPDGAFTIEGWIRGDDFGGRRAFLAKTEKSEYGLFVSDGRPVFSVFLGRGYVTASEQEPVLEPGRWHHVAGVFDGSEVRLYVDGKLLAAQPGEGRRRRNEWPLFVGADPDRRGHPTSGFDGLIDEVRVSQGARYGQAPFEPARRFEPDDDTLLLLHLDRGLGPIAPDHAAGGRHALSRGKVEYAPLD